MNDGTIVTRFAPSPTGSLHVGGARTALFNWAYARGHGGKFILRIEDTDQRRSTDESTRGILRDLQWLGIDWDQGPDPDDLNSEASKRYFQSQRLDLYNTAITRLMESGQAYEDAGAIRFRMPQKDITVQDQVLSTVTVKAGEIEDFVIRKGDGFPTYHLAVVVDDADMGVTHVIRGQEHLNNATKHWALQEAIGLPHPTYAHIPLIFNADGSKMSKRDKAKAARAAANQWLKENNADLDTFKAKIREHRFAKFDLIKPKLTDDAIDAFLAKESDDIDLSHVVADVQNISLPEIEVQDFIKSGYLPSALNNYLALLGWNPGGDVEHFDNAFLCERFDLDRVGKSNAKFDRDKLASFNQHALALMTPESLAEALYAYSPALQKRFERADHPTLVTFAQAYRERSKTLAEPEIQGAFLFAGTGDIAYDDANALKKVMDKNDGEGWKALAAFLPTLEGLDPWSGSAAHEAIHAYCQQHELGMGKIAQPIRFAISGTTVTPPLDMTLDILGRDKTLRRIKNCLTHQPGA